MVDILLGDPAVEPLWHWNVWSATVAHLDPIMSSPRGKTAVRTLQYSDRKVVRFGRLTWDLASHEKWTAAEALTSGVGRRFSSVEVWAPSWTVCEKDNRPPDAFLWIQNEAAIFKAVSFNPTVLLALAEDGPAREEARAAAIQALASHARPLLHASKTRAWGNTSGSGFTDAIQDLVLTGLFRPGKRHGTFPTLELFTEPWAEVSG